MKRIVEATYPSLDFGNEVRDIEKECSHYKVRSRTVWRCKLRNCSLTAMHLLASGRV